MTPELILPALTLIALVADETTALRAGPSEQAPVQLRLARGAWVEPRGEAGAWLKVFDHEHARSGYVRPAAVRVHPWAVTEAPTFATLAAFLRDSAGSESLGIAYATAALKLDPDPSHAPALAEAIGTMADRLARRASQRSLTPDQSASLAAQIPVAESWGVKFVSFDREGAARLCADPDPLRRALEADDPITRTRAALALTTAACVADDTPAVARRQWNAWRSEVLERASTDDVPAYLAQRVRLRRAEVHGELAFTQARLDEAAARESAEKACESVLALDPVQVAAEDLAWSDRVTIVASASRWAGLPTRELPAFLTITPRDDGATCVRAGDHERCTFGRVWTSSLVADPARRIAALVVQTVPELTELWLVTPDRLEVILPSTAAFEAGVVEPAGLTPDGTKLLVARVSQQDGVTQRWFEVIRIADGRTLQRVRRLDENAAFRKWASPVWVGSTRLH